MVLPNTEPYVITSAQFKITESNELFCQLCQLGKDELKGQELTRARIVVGAKKSDVRIDITDSEWEAIQAGAVSDSFLQKILEN